MEVKEVKIGDWVFMISPKQLSLEREQIKVLENLLSKWEEFFPKEGTWVQNKVGKPSLIVRFDLACLANEKMGIFEIEERPAGLGIAARINPLFAKNFSLLFKKWREFYGVIGVIVSHRREKRGDDELWINLVGAPLCKGLPNTKNLLCLVRAEPEESEYHSLIPNSISTVACKGIKSYGLPMNFWKENLDNPNDLPWKEGFVLKPHQGSKMENIYIWPPPPFDKKYKGRGNSTRTKIMTSIREGRVKYVQPWIQPEEHCFLPKDYLVMRRLFFGWEPKELRWIYLGGIWNARKNLMIHGASDAIFGSIL